MGIGDEIMASGQARKLFDRTKTPVLIVDASRRPRWSPVWEGLPYIARRPAGRYQPMINGPGARPYIAAKGERQWLWRKFDLRPGEIALTEAERDMASHHAGFIVVEPNIKGTNGGNKAWIWGRWQALADALPGQVIQFAANADTQVLRGVRVLRTPSFRDACAVLAQSRALVTTEGGLHHAAAALGVPAVVLFSHFIAPSITGYHTHRNIYHAGAPCGSRTECQACRASMEAITVEEVIRNLQEIVR